MKKITIILLSLLILLCGCGKEESPETLPGTQPTETIQDVTGPEAIMDPEDITEPVEMETVSRLVRTSVLDQNGNESWYQEYFYDEYGREEQTSQYMDGVITYFASTTYTSDREYEMSVERQNSKYAIRYTCDDAGRVIRQETIQEDGTTEYTEYTYDDHGNQLTMKMVYADGSEITLTYEYTYDDQGNQLVRKEYQNGTLAGWLEMEYDEAGREVASVYYHPDGSVNYTTASTWEDNTETRVSYDSDGVAYITMITALDEAGNTLSRETWQEGVMVSRTEYTYELLEIIAQ